MAIILSGFLLRFSCAIINLYVFTLPGGEFDAVSFNVVATDFSNHLEQGKSYKDFNYKFGWVYSIFIGYIYYFFGASNLLGSFLSCIAWFISALILRTIMIKLNYEKNHILMALLIYAFLFPTSIIYTSLMLREAYLLLFSNIIFLTIINIYYSKNIIPKVVNFIILIFISILLISFHKAGILFVGSFSIFLILFLSYRFLPKILNYFSFFLFILLSIFLFEYFGIFEKIFLEIKNYQSGHFERFVKNRALYYQPYDIFLREYSMFNLIKVFMENIFNYFLQPTFSNISDVKDLPAVFENNLRVLAIIFLLYAFFFDFENKNLFIILFFMFFISEAVYAQATVNWGTASRHHVPALGLLVLLFFFPKKKNNKRN
tara:strand:- start:1983 stop:3104 length:1122 start_codon:yes stop_codon:yes gene_type:complete